MVLPNRLTRATLILDLVQVRKSELVLEFVDVVSHVEDKAPVVAAILDASESPADHLKIKVGAIHRTSYDYGPRFRSIESLAEDSVIDQRFHISGPKLFDDTAATGGVS